MNYEQKEMSVTTRHNYMLRTLIACDIYQNNHVEIKATSWPWKPLMGD